LYRANGPPFTEVQAISTQGAFDFDSFVIDGETYLAVANHANDSSQPVDARVYKWDPLMYLHGEHGIPNGLQLYQLCLCRIVQHVLVDFLKKRIRVV